MLLKNISLTNFRNHRQFSLELPDSSIPVYISGENGAGKTSLIEAVYLIYTLRTFRQQALSDIRTFNEAFMRIEGEFEGQENIEKAVFFYQQERRLLINGVENFMSNAEYTHITPVICYSPSFESLLSPEHSDRRRFLDRMIFYTDKTHMAHVKRYNLLMQRKRAELDRDKPDKELLSILNDQLAPLSSIVSEARRKLVEGINSSLKSTPYEVALLMPETELVLSVNSLDGRDFDAETARGRPMYGCHKDLLYVKKSGKIIEKFQSFGQKKSCLLLLLYHLALMVQSERKDDIVLLYDDFEAGLDDGRIAVLNRLMADGVKRQLILSGIDNKRHPDALTVKLQELL